MVASINTIFCVRSLSWLIVFWLVGLSVSAQEMLRYTFRHTGREQGFPANRIVFLHQDRRGYIWMGTNVGLVRYDGAEFVTWPMPKYKGAEMGLVSRIQEDRLGWLWLFQNSADGHVSVFNPHTGVLQRLLEEDKPLTGHSIYERGQELYLSTNKGIQRFDRRTMTVGETLLDSSRISPREGSQWTDRQGRFWGRHVPTSVMCYDWDKKEVYNKHNNPFGWEILNENPGFAHKAFDTLGNPWFTTGFNEENTHDFYHFNLQTGRLLHKTFDQYKHKTDFSIIESVVVHPSGQVWFGTTNGRLCRYFPERDSFDCITQNRNDAESLGITNTVEAIMADREGNIWVDVDNGVDVFHPIQQNVTTIRSGQKDNRPPLYPGNVIQTKQGDIFVGQGFEYVKQFDEQLHLKKTITLPHLYQKQMKNEEGGPVVVEAPDGKIWIGGESKTIVQYDPRTGIKTYLSCPALRHGLIRCFLKTRNGDIWMADSLENLVRWDHRRRVFSPHPLPGIRRPGPWEDNRFVTVLFEDEQQRLWAGSSGGGIARLNPTTGVVERSYYITPTGTTEDASFNQIWDIIPWNTDSLLIGSGNGLLWLNLHRDTLTRWSNIMLPDQYIMGLQKDQKGDLWIFNEYNLYRLAVNGWHIKTIDQSIGLTRQRYTRHLITLRDGRLLVCAKSGDLVIFHPDSLLRTPLRVFEPVFTAVRVGQTLLQGIDSMVLTSQTLQLAYHQNNLTFAYASLTYGTSGITYRYRLGGLDTAWVDAGTRRQVNYSNLSPGQYQFEVAAVGPGGQETAPTILFFQIFRPWWRTGWFYALCFLSSGGLAFWIVRARLRRFRERALYEKRLAELENEALRAQMKPHFVSNALLSINQLMDKDVPKASYYIERFAALMRQILVYSRQNAITLEKELEMLENYLQLEQLRAGFSWDYHIETSGANVSSGRRVPSMLLQPFVENAILHGLSNLHNERRGLLTLRFQTKNEGLLIEIEDNGVGRARAEALKNSIQREHHQSVGIEIAIRRLAIFSEMSDTPSHFKMVDLFDAQGRATGTRVELLVAG